ncbi:Bacterial type II secretion system protein G [Gimesia alba]|uniref:Bacterial type II secretion system protein G n=1 Tax=Gimesia alba TaxID=2527973 RepID=A0A517REC0_9PLAN|nr:type II secretion system protein GspG [Gimesia alba]QDT42218.1 Bacterial type II secretion system protein G [Gimesia alba]
MLRRLLPRLLIALLCGFVVFVILNVAAWYNLRGAYHVCRKQSFTRYYTLLRLREQIEDYRRDHEALPDELSEIPDFNSLRSLSDNPTADGWGNPIQYRRTGENYELFSWGRDGKPGGVGLDADLYHDGRNRELSLPTFSQFFLTNDESEVARDGFLRAGLMAGVLVAFITLLSLRDTEKSEEKMTTGRYVWFTFVVIVISSAVGIFLLPVHIPSGH